MTKVEEWKFFTEQLQESALKEYHTSHEYELRKTRREQLDDMLCNEFSADKRAFIEDILYELISFHDRETDLLYQQGMKDCVWLLRNLGVLA